MIKAYDGVEVPYPIRLLDLLENLVQWRFLSSGGWVPRLCLAWACVTARRAVLMGGSPDIPHIHIPGAITELADLSDIHPFPAIPHGDFIVRADPDAFLHAPARPHFLL